ncbi:MAG TPA: DMT family transporter [Flavitalea sp.]|nr:DMT family transporter [Flavitalea sp.]
MNKWKAHAAVLSANLIFGFNFSAVQYITRNWVAPFGLNVIRVTVSSALLWIVLLFGKQQPGIRKEHIGRFILCALTGVVINQLLFIKGLSMTLSIHASLLILVTPIFITFVAAWLGQEGMSVLKIAGLVLGVSGAVMLAMERPGSHKGNDILWGDIFIIINAISYAFYFVLVKPLMKEYSPVHVLRWVFTIGLIVMVPIGWNEFNAIHWSSFSWREFSVLAFIVLFATFFAYLFNIYGIQYLGASITGAYIYTQPVFATLIAVIFLNEMLTWYKAAAAVLIAGGVLLVSRKKEAT